MTLPPQRWQGHFLVWQIHIYGVLGLFYPMTGFGRRYEQNTKKVSLPHFEMTSPQKIMTLPHFSWQGRFLMWQGHFIVWQSHFKVWQSHFPI